jgi:hypothetical protein
MMRKSLWIIPALLLVAVIAVPQAQADMYSVAFVGGTTTPVDPTIAVNGSGQITFLNVTDDGYQFSFNAPFGAIGDDFSWQLFLASCTNACSYVQENLEIIDGGEYEFVTSQNLFGGPIISDGGTIQFTDTSIITPEPATGVLMLIGVALAVVMRKRLAPKLPVAT